MTPRVLALGLVGLLTCLAFVADKEAAAASRPAMRATPVRPRTEGMQLIATVRPVRQIAMFYRLDLARDNALAMPVAHVMRQNEHRIRACYVDRLEARPRLQGRLALRFELSKTTGTMQQIARAGGDIEDPRLLRCVKQQLALLPFNPPRDLRGTLQYTFGVVGGSQGAGRAPAVRKK